jgi:SagB-type dehydrogenase family enzyme
VNILDYHQRSKHRLDRYAPGPGHLDWATQPDPFRTYAGAPCVVLPLGADTLTTRFEAPRRGALPPPAAFDLPHVAMLFELSLGLSAWKEYGGTRWALRCNPSSGNLHPTEGYLISAALPGIRSGVHHYVSRDHALEQRASVDAPAWGEAFAPSGCYVALSSIHWREAWKYGMRAFRYCQHDCGHAVAALAYAAAALGWRTAPVTTVSDADLARLIGTTRDADLPAEEMEAADALLWIGAGDAAPDPAPLLRAIETASWHGHANRLSPAHLRWSEIEQAHGAALKTQSLPAPPWLAPQRPPPLSTGCEATASRLILQRRSAVAFDGVTSMSADAFHALLDATLPRPGVPPWQGWPNAPAVHLALFVHRVRGMEPGLYFLLRDEAALETLRRSLRADWLWQRHGPQSLPLYLLAPGDLRQLAQLVSCHQDIAADSCFSLGMLASFTGVAEEPWRYRQLYWECGMIGQVLYLEAEAARLRGTGIGCFFDDEVHELLGLTDPDWQSLYHFTVGGPVEDRRLTTLPPYAARRMHGASTGETI